MKSMTAADPIIYAITHAMSWCPSEDGPSYSEVRSEVDAVIHGEIARLRTALANAVPALERHWATVSGGPEKSARLAALNRAKELSGYEQSKEEMKDA